MHPMRANRRRVTYDKVKRDIDRVTSGPSEKPHVFRLVAGGPVSAKLRDRIKGHGKTKGMTWVEVW